MNEPIHPTSRREFIKTTGRLAAASAFAGMTVPYVHAQGNETLQVALIGCGGRGTGAAANAMGVTHGPVKLVAMADVFQDRLNTSYDALMKDHSQQMDVPEDRKFIGFDGYRHAMDALKPGDIAIFTTPLAFRWVHFTYAIEKRLNVFMEKPLTADGPTSRKMLALAEQASAKNLKVGVGLMSRHARPLQELQQRIQNGEIGDVILLRGYRMSGPLGSAFSNKWPGDPSELLWQIKRFHSFIWASGGCFNDFYIHHIDHLCWMKNAWPVKAQALGGRHYRGTAVDQNFDSYSVEYTFDDGTKMSRTDVAWPVAMTFTPATRTVPKAWLLLPRTATASRHRPFIAARSRNVTSRFGNPNASPTIAAPTTMNGMTWSRRSATTSLTMKFRAESTPLLQAQWAVWPPTRARKSRSRRC